VDIDVAECCISTGLRRPQQLRRDRRRAYTCPEEGIYIYMPEMVFGDLTNYEEIADERNSYGVKLANLGYSHSTTL
jgi:hypothetical protein